MSVSMPLALSCLFARQSLVASAIADVCMSWCLGIVADIRIQWRGHRGYGWQGLCSDRKRPEVWGAIPDVGL